MAWTMKVDAEDKIRKNEAKRNKEDIAKSSLKEGLSIEVIMKITGLTKEEIEELKDK